MELDETKICTKCHKEKLITEFSKDKRNKDGLGGRCKKCLAEKNKKWRKINPGKVKANHKKWYENNPEKVKANRKRRHENNPEYFKEYRKIHKEQLKEHYKEHYKENKEKYLEYREIHKKEIRKYREKYEKNNKKKISKYQKKYRELNREKINSTAKIRMKEKRENDPIFRLNGNISQGVYSSLKGNKNGRHWEALVDYNQQDLRGHLEKQFKKGMNWKNYGKWHVDHKIPIDSFNITSTECEDFKRCWALSNLQPLWEKDNLEKRNKILPEFAQIELYY